MFEYDECSKAAAKELDKYDFTEILSSCYDNEKNGLWDVIDAIIEKHNELDVDDGALDNLSSDEIMEYLSKRYNVRFESIITYRMYYCK